MITERNEDDFRAKRREGIGGSDIPIIMGLSGYMTPYQLYLEKLGLLSAERVETPNQYWGKQIEPLIRAEFAKRNNVTIENRENRSHPILTFMKGNLDGFIKEWNAVFEAKCSIMTKAHEWDKTNSDGVPLTYLCQVAHYCFIENVEKAYFGVLIGGYDYREYTYHHDKALEKKLVSFASEFWKAVQEQSPPPPVDDRDLLLMYPQHESIQLPADKIILQHIHQLHEVKGKAKELAAMEREAKFEIMQFMGNAEGIINENEDTLVTWKTNKRGHRTFLLKNQNDSEV